MVAKSPAKLVFTEYKVLVVHLILLPLGLDLSGGLIMLIICGYLVVQMI